MALQISKVLTSPKFVRYSQCIKGLKVERHTTTCSIRLNFSDPNYRLKSKQNYRYFLARSSVGIVDSHHNRVYDKKAYSLKQNLSENMI